MKIINYSTAVEICKKNQSKGLTVLVKTGCYDIIHVGHINMFRNAANIADIVIVGVGTDDNISSYKRKMIYDQNNRMEVLSELESIDYVVLLDEPMIGTIDHRKFLELVRPDYYYVPNDDSSLNYKKIMAEELGIKIIIENNIELKNYGSIIEPHSSDILNIKLYHNKIEELYSKELNFLKDIGNLTDDWYNVYEHCRMEGYIAMILSRMLDLSTIDMDILIKSALLHDWYKRTERESENYNTNYSWDNLVKNGYSETIANIAHSVGHTSLKTIESKDLLCKAMHFIDDITNGTEIKEISERVETTRSTGRYFKLEQDFRLILDGRSFFDVQIEVGNKIQNELEDICKVERGTLVKILKEKYKKIMLEKYTFSEKIKI